VLTGGPSGETFAWFPGDGADVAEGGTGSDTAAVTGSSAVDNLSVAPTAGRLRILLGAETPFDTNDVETARLIPAGGADIVTVPDLSASGTELTGVAVDLGGSDGATDNVLAAATNNPETFNVTPAGGGARVGLAVPTTVTGAAIGEDTLTLQALGGDDVVDASTVPAGLVDLVLQGGLGGDTFIGSQGSDLMVGGDGDDLALFGAGNDTFQWNPGDDNDTVEGQSGSDRLLFNGANVAENIDIAANGGRMRFFRNIASVTMDCNDVETVDFNALGGADNIVVNDMTGTDLSQVNLSLAATGGGGDAAADNVTLTGTNAADNVLIGGDAASVTATGLATALTVTGAEAANDRLTVNGLAGNDTIDATEVGVGAILLTLNGDANNDTLIGGDGNDTLNGGTEDDFLKGGPGTDALDGGTGTNTLIQD
jgi:Ca2+-binding RTX toxin-like protein